MFALIYFKIIPALHLQTDVNQTFQPFANQKPFDTEPSSKVWISRSNQKSEMTMKYKCMCEGLYVGGNKCEGDELDKRLCVYG